MFDNDYNAFADNPIGNQDPSEHCIFNPRFLVDVGALAATDSADSPVLERAAKSFKAEEKLNEIDKPELTIQEIVQAKAQQMINSIKGISSYNISTAAILRKKLTETGRGRNHQSFGIDKAGEITDKLHATGEYNEQTDTIFFFERAYQADRKI